MSSIFYIFLHFVQSGSLGVETHFAHSTGYATSLDRRFGLSEDKALFPSFQQEDRVLLTIYIVHL